MSFFLVNLKVYQEAFPAMEVSSNFGMVILDSHKDVFILTHLTVNQGHYPVLLIKLHSRWPQHFVFQWIL